MNKVFVRWTVLIGLLSLCSFASAQSAQEEVEKQIAKLIGDAVSNRVAGQVLDTGVAPGTRTATSGMPNNIWGSYSHLVVDFDGVGKSHTNIYVGGYDRELNNKVILGAAVNYAETNGVNSDSWGIDPYIAYRFSDTFFGIARVGYARSDFDEGGISGDVDIYSMAFSLNAAHRMTNLLLRGRVELGYFKANVSFSGNGFSGDSSDHAAQVLADGELGYFFSQGLYGFAGLQAGKTNNSDSYSLFGRIGLEKEFSKAAAVQLKWEHKLDDNSGFNFDVDTVTLAARFRF